MVLKIRITFYSILFYSILYMPSGKSRTYSTVWTSKIRLDVQKLTQG